MNHRISTEREVRTDASDSDTAMGNPLSKPSLPGARAHVRTMHEKLVPFLVGAVLIVSLSVTLFFFFHQHIGGKVIRGFNYGQETFEKYESVRKEWRPRIGSTLLTRLYHTKDKEVMKTRIAWSFALWYAALCLVYLGIHRKAAPFLMLGTLAALVYDASPMAEKTWYPWDMPALFFSALALWAILRQRLVLLALSLGIGVLFKETVLIMAFFVPFFPDLPRKRKAMILAGLLGAGWLIRLVVELSIGNPVGPESFSYHINGDPNAIYRWQENLGFLFSLKLNHVLWANVGMLALVLLLPSVHPILRGTRWVALLFYGGLFFAASFNELRVFLEILPASLLLLHEYLYRSGNAEALPVERLPSSDLGR